MRLARGVWIIGDVSVLNDSRHDEDLLAAATVYSGGREVEAALDAAIASLDPGQREGLVLRDIEGLTAPEVATVLAVSVEAVKSRLHRARLTLREKLAPVLGPPAMTARPAACADVLTLLSRHLEDDLAPDAWAFPRGWNSARSSKISWPSAAGRRVSAMNRRSSLPE